VHINAIVLHKFTPKMTAAIFIMKNTTLHWLLKTWVEDWLKVTEMAELTKQKDISLTAMGFVNTCSDKYMLFVQSTMRRVISILACRKYQPRKYRFFSSLYPWKSTLSTYSYIKYIPLIWGRWVCKIHQQLQLFWVRLLHLSPPKQMNTML
jgi:hypothetical protein